MSLDKNIKCNSADEGKNGKLLIQLQTTLQHNRGIESNVIERLTEMKNCHFRVSQHSNQFAGEKKLPQNKCWQTSPLSVTTGAGLRGRIKLNHYWKI